MSLVVPDACTLPVAQQPARRAEFADLFAGAAPSVRWIDAAHARLRLVGPAGLTERVRDLAARESACCAFFTFTVTGAPDPDGEAVVFDIEVPAGYADVLAALIGLAGSGPEPC